MDPQGKEEAIHQCREGKKVHASCSRGGSKGQSSERPGDFGHTEVEITAAVSSMCVGVCVKVYLQLCLSFFG